MDIPYDIKITPLKLFSYKLYEPGYLHVQWQSTSLTWITGIRAITVHCMTLRNPTAMFSLGLELVRLVSCNKAAKEMQYLVHSMQCILCAHSPETPLSFYYLQTEQYTKTILTLINFFHRGAKGFRSIWLQVLGNQLTCIYCSTYIRHTPTANVTRCNNFLWAINQSQVSPRIVWLCYQVIYSAEGTTFSSLT